MSETNTKATYFSIGFIVAFIIFIILYFTIVYEEKTTMRKDSKYYKVKNWANYYIKYNLNDPNYLIKELDLYYFIQIHRIVKKQILDLYPTNKTPAAEIQRLAFYIININTVKEFNNFYNYNELNLYEDTTMRNDPRYAKASEWALGFEKIKNNEINYVLTDNDVKMMDITTDIVMNQINKLYPNNKVKKEKLNRISYKFINLAMVITFNKLYAENKFNI